MISTTMGVKGYRFIIGECVGLDKMLHDKWISFITRKLEGERYNNTESV
jgi:hypothetical protein